MERETDMGIGGVRSRERLAGIGGGEGERGVLNF